MSTNSISHSSYFTQKAAGPLSSIEFRYILSFLELEEQVCSARVCRIWSQFINSEEQWKIQCQYKSGILTDPKKYIPEGLSYKECFQLISSRILDGSVYRRYIGEIGPVPPIPEEFSPKRWNEPDPCDPKGTIGKAYILIYCPEYIEITVPEDSPLDLDKPDNPFEAPKLILRKAELMEKSSKEIGPGTKSKNKILKVLVTINNIVTLFGHPKRGNPSIYNFVLDDTMDREQYGNKRIQAGWMGVRESAIGSGKSFAEQQKLAEELGVVSSDLIRRILFNALQYVRSRNARVYPDGQDPHIFTFTRTLACTDHSINRDESSGCGNGGRSGLNVRYICLVHDGNGIGLAVMLPRNPAPYAILTQ